MLICVSHFTKPHPKPAGIIGHFVCCEGYRGVLWTGPEAAADCKPRWQAMFRFPGFGAIQASDSGKAIVRVGEGAGAFIQFESDEQRDARFAKIGPAKFHALNRFEAMARRMAVAGC